jgi:NAD(P)-dependent dehydrogenase (short-subunit alcohol dehydrogenase family)
VIGGEVSVRLAGKHAIVTGAGSGIGRAIAERFHREGASVALVDRRGDALCEVEAAISGGPQVVSCVADVSSEAEVAKAFEGAEGSLGSIDIVVANAGVQLFGQDAPVDELDLEVWQLTIDVNLTGMFLTCKYGIRALLSSGGGSVICLGSPTGLRGTASRFHAYSASKAGAFGLTRVMAADYAQRNIRVNALVPGFTNTALVSELINDDVARARITGRVPMRRYGEPDEIAAVALFLASDEASYVTGATYIVDGGETIL